MKLLLHICCAPCATGALAGLRAEFAAAEITGIFYNPNIHPESEWQQRRDTLESALPALDLPVQWYGDEHGITTFLESVGFSGDPTTLVANPAAIPAVPARCRQCYALRLSLVAQQAARGNFDAFSTTLLISPYQDQEALAKVGTEIGRCFGPDFLYRDLRPYYRFSRQRSHELGLYMQKYCGCIFSKIERELKK
jgi:epoxyqueuosine reductase